MRPRNTDFIDRHLEVERRERRRRFLDDEGEWVDLRPYLAGDWSAQIATPIARVVDGFVEWSGAVLALGNNTTTLFDGLPAGLYPDGGNFGGNFGVQDIWLPIDTDNPSTILPVGMGWSADVVGSFLALTGDVRIDAAHKLVNGTAIENAGAGNNNGWPMTNVAVILNGVSYVVDGSVGALS